MIDSSARLEGACGLRGLWLLSTMIVSSFSSYVPSIPLPVLILLWALPFVGDLLLELCLPAARGGVMAGMLEEMVPGRPLWFPCAIAADSAGVALTTMLSLGCFCFVGGTKWYSCRASYAAFTLLNAVFRTRYRLFHASCAPLHTTHFLIADLSTLVGQSFELCGSV